jgi:hypothetical protein
MKIVFLVLLFGGTTWGQTRPATTQPLNIGLANELYPALTKKLMIANAKVAQLEQEVADLKMQIIKIGSDRDALRNAAATRPAAQVSEKIRIAILKHELCVGMTMAQADEAMESTKTLDYEDEQVKAYRWGGKYGKQFTADFEAGKIVRWEQFDGASEPRISNRAPAKQLQR